MSAAFHLDDIDCFEELPITSSCCRFGSASTLPDMKRVAGILASPLSDKGVTSVTGSVAGNCRTRCIDHIGESGVECSNIKKKHKPTTTRPHCLKVKMSPLRRPLAMT